MKKNYSKMLGIVLITLLIAGCRKEDHTNECRLVFGTNADPTGSSDFTFHYNNKGLADEWDISNYGAFKQEYDAAGRLKKAILTQDGEVTAVVSFFYNRGTKVTKEIWYAGNGTDTSDIVYYYYNAQDNLVKVQSFLNDWIGLGKYTPDGNLSSSELFFSGSPVYSAFYTYNKRVKNPYLAVPGVDHLYPFYTPMDLFYGKWRWAALKQLAYDEDGNPVVLFEYDPSKTMWQAGPRNYSGLVTYFDLLSNNWFPYRYEFENCSGDRNDDGSNSQIATPPTASRITKLNPMMILRRNPAKSMQQQVKEFRQQLKNIKN